MCKNKFPPGILYLLLLILTAIAFVNVIPVYAAADNSIDISVASEGLWSEAAEPEIVTLSAGERSIIPERYRTVAIDRNVLGRLLSRTPSEGSEASKISEVLMTLPLPDGSSGRFRIVESPVMAPELAAKFPEIKTFSGQGVDDPSATVRFDWTPHGFHAMILSPSGRIFIDPYSAGDTIRHISYYTRDHITPKAGRLPELPPIDPRGAKPAGISSLAPAAAQRSSGTQLRTYRLAVAATREYTAYHGGTVALGLAAVVTAVNRVSGIYEAEVAVRLQLVTNNNLLIYTNSNFGLYKKKFPNYLCTLYNNEPYTNDDGGVMLDENQANLDCVIGSSNYDIGHVFSTGGGGVAYLGVTCNASYKGGGVTGSSIPTGDVFWVDYVAHEMGHQFGANHTFNSETGSCNGNRESTTAYEPGSGSTIMAYAGICGPDDLQSNSDAYFHTVSFDEILDYITWDEGSTCGTVANSGNIPPVANAGSGGLTIPANTPFTLTGSAIDSNGDPLTYCWEEFDLIDPTGVIDGGPPGDPTNPPFFRSWPATSSPSRTFPRLSELLNNTTVLGEVLPDTSRALNFRLTVRDNRSGGGGVDYDSMTFNVTSLAGPFQVTAPNTAVSWAGNSSQTVTWNVANTGSGTTVNCANVGILLSTDGGYTFPTTLAPSTPNDGSQSVTVPNVSTATARIKVYCTGNIFFDISNSNFTITYTPTPVAVTVTTSPSGRQITVDGTTYTPPQTFNWIPGGSHTIAISDAQTTQSGSPGTQYVYASWSDGGTKSHTITSPATPTTYTANFTTRYLLTTSTAGAAGTVTPDCSGGCWHNSGSTVSLSPAPAGGNTFSLWSGDISSVNAPLILTMTGPKNITANFNPVDPGANNVRIGGLTPVYYPTIAAAYAAAINNDVIQTKDMTYAETLDFNRADIPTVTLRGGYNGTYSDNTEKSTINSPLTIRSGTITLDNFIVR